MQRERETRRRGTVRLEGAASAARQGIKQAAHRARAHGFITVEFIMAVRCECQEGSEESSGRAGITDVNLGVGVRDAPPESVDANRTGRLVEGDFEPERLQRGDEDARIAAEERAGKMRDAIGQGG